MLVFDVPISHSLSLYKGRPGYMNCLITKSLSCYRGKGDYYRLGTDSTAHVREPQLVESLSKKVVQVAVGSLHILALTENGEVSQWPAKMHHIYKI